MGLLGLLGDGNAFSELKEMKGYTQEEGHTVTPSAGVVGGCHPLLLKREEGAGAGFGACREQGGRGGRGSACKYRGDRGRAAAGKEQGPRRARVQGPGPRAAVRQGHRGALGLIGHTASLWARLTVAREPPCGPVGQLLQPGRGWWGGVMLPELGPALSPGHPQGCELVLVWRLQPGGEEGLAERPLPPSLPQQFLVEEEDEKVDVDLGLVEELHNSYTFVLELQEVLGRGQGWGARGLLVVARPVYTTLTPLSLPRPPRGAGHQNPSSQMRTSRPREAQGLDQMSIRAESGLQTPLSFKRPKGRTKRRGFKVTASWGAWVAQSVERPTSAQVTISRLVSSSPTLGSVLTARRLLGIPPLSLSLSLCPSIARALSLKINKPKQTKSQLS